MTRAMIFPFSCTDTSLPVQDMTRPVTDAIRDYSAESLAAGKVVEWPSLAGGSRLAAASSTGGMMVAAEGGKKHASFDGYTRADEALPLTQAFTYMIWVRFPGGLAADRIIVGSPAASGAIVATDSTGTKYQGYAGSVLTTVGGNDTGWHVVTVVFNGTNSTVDVDGSSTTGNAGTNSTAGPRLATSSTVTGAAVMDVRRFAIFNKALTPTEIALRRAEITA